MNKKSFIIILGLFLLISQFQFIIAQTNINYCIIEDKVLVNLNITNFQEIELKIPKNSRISGTNLNTSQYIVLNKDNQKIITFNQNKDFYFEYITDFYIDKTSKTNYFQLYNPLNKKHNATLFLSEGSILNEEGILFPNPNQITSDGKRIILKWKNFQEEQIIVSYNNLSNQGLGIYLFIGILILLIFLIYLIHIKKYQKKIKKIQLKQKKNKNKKNKEFTKNLVKEEKKIIEYLFNKKRKESWTKEIVKDLGIGKVKLARKLRNLEEKGLIKKVPYGNENKIILKK